MSAARQYAKIESAYELQILAEKLLAEGKPVGFDIETGYIGPDKEKGALNIDWDAQFIVGFSITNSEEWARYIPIAHDYGTNVENAWEIIAPVLTTLPVIAHNMKFEKRNLRALSRKGKGKSIEINDYGDSCLQSYVLSEHEYHGLKGLVKEVFGHEMATLESLFPDVKKNKLKNLRFNTLDTSLPEVVAYACEDASWCLSLHNYFEPRVQGHDSRKFMYDLEMRIMNLLCDMEDAGHAVDWESLNEQQEYGEPFYEHMVNAARSGLSDMAGEDLSQANLNSTLQMREILYGKLGMHTTVTTPKGEYSTGAIALEALSREHLSVKKILESREVKNLTGRLKKWRFDYSQCYDARVHPSFNQVAADRGGDTGAAIGSGRFSANDPSIQQLPKNWRWCTLMSDQIDVQNDDHWAELEEKAIFGKHYWGGNFRDFLVAAEGCYLLGFDYSQIELRALAGLSQEPALLEAFNNDEDVHTLTAAMMLGVPVSEITKTTRAIGKTMNFALLYGMGAKSLAERLALSRDEADALYAQYFSAFTKVTEWMSKMKNYGTTLGYVETAFGRKWTLWDLKSHSKAQQGKGERLCVNAPVQGTAADIMKIAMLKVKKAMVEKGWWMTKVRMINNIHDALTFEVDNSIDPNELKEILQSCVVWEIPNFPKIIVDWELGQRWGSSAEWKPAKGHTVEFDGTHWNVVTPDGSAPAVKVAEYEEETVEEVFELQEAAEEVTAEPVLEDMTVEMNVMPEKAAFGRFLALLTDHPGQTLITLKTPEGTVDLEKYRTSLTPDQQGEISLALSGAKVYYPTEANIDELAEGLFL